MGTPRSKILAIFLMLLFIQRVGPSIYVKTYICEHIYKETCITSTEVDQGRVHSQTMICMGNRVYEECNNIVIPYPIELPPIGIKHINVQHKLDRQIVFIGTFLKRSALRGPPYSC